MADEKAVTQLLDESLAELDKIINDDNAERALRKQAVDRFERLSMMRVKELLAEHEGRTKIIAGLIADLNAVTQGIAVTNPVAARVNKLVDRAEALSTSLKKLGEIA